MKLACLSVDWDILVMPGRPDFSGTRWYTCPRCDNTFSERNPTFMSGLKSECDAARKEQVDAAK